MSEHPATVTLPRADWEILLEFVQIHAQKQEIASELWKSWGNEITSMVRSQLVGEDGSVVLEPVTADC